MPPKTMKYIVAGIIILAVGIFLALKFRPAQEIDPVPVAVSDQVDTQKKIEVEEDTPKPVISYNKLENDPETKAKMKERKEELGVEDSVDLIVTKDEIIEVGDSKVSVQEIIEEIAIHEGEILETDISDNNKNEKVRSYEKFGIYIVKPGDNIWDIHYSILKDFFKKQGIEFGFDADEPSKNGYSSGVGKILKFSENMVYIYNLKEKKLETDLDLIHPLNRIVIYNMDKVFNILEQIDYTQMDHLKFDGDTIWLPAKE